MTPKTVLVTGADGFIGSHLTEALVRQGFTVRAFVYYNSFNSWGWLDQCAEEIKGQFEVFPGDVRDPHGVKEAMKGCDAVLHLAALENSPMWAPTSITMESSFNIRRRSFILSRSAASSLFMAQILPIN